MVRIGFDIYTNVGTVATTVRLNSLLCQAALHCRVVEMVDKFLIEDGYFVELICELIVRA